MMDPILTATHLFLKDPRETTLARHRAAPGTLRHWSGAVPRLSDTRTAGEVRI